MCSLLSAKHTVLAHANERYAWQAVTNCIANFNRFEDEVNNVDREPTIKSLRPLKPLLQMPAMDGALRGAASRAHHQQRPPSPQQPRPPSRALLQAGRMYWYRGAWHALPPPPTTALQPDVQPPVFLPVSNVAAASEASVRGAAPLAQAPDVSAGFGSAPPSTAAGPGDAIHHSACVDGV